MPCFGDDVILKAITAWIHCMSMFPSTPGSPRAPLHAAAGCRRVPMARWKSLASSWPSPGMGIAKLLWEMEQWLLNPVLDFYDPHYM